MASKELEIFLTIKTAVADADFEVISISGEEQLSSLFTYRVKIGCDDPNVDISKILGQPATFRIAAEDATEQFRNGIVSSISQSLDEQGLIIYDLEIVPAFWLLKHISDNRIFQNQTTAEILSDVFKQFGIDVEYKIAGGQKREFCVQYDETYFDFLSRLMEEEGIYYYFKHEDEGHVLMVTNNALKHDACPGLDGSVMYQQFDATFVQENTVTAFAVDRRVVTNHFQATDYNFKSPATDLLVDQVGKNSNGKVTRYEYPGGYDAKGVGGDIAQVRIEELEYMNNTANGTGNCRDFVSGFSFVLKEHDRKELNGEYVIDAIHFEVNQETYSNTFTCFPVAVPYRPQRKTPKPVMAGYQIATVVGKSGEEIWTDEFGRVTVHFPWDVRSNRDESSSCWIRVAQPWAGNGWGTLSIPRIGTEVLIAFLDGDPDRPVIIGTVYNGKQTVPYSLPDEKTKSTTKTNSSKGGDGFNEIRFEDLAGSEEVYLHAQKDMNVEILDNRTTVIGATNTLTVGGADSETFNDTRDIAVAKADTESYSATRTITVQKDETETFSQNQTVTVGKSNSTSIGENHSLTVAKGSSETVGGMKSVSVTKEYTITSKKLQITANEEIVLKTGSAEIIMKKNGDITINGKKIQVKASGDIVMKGSKIKQN